MARAGKAKPVYRVQDGQLHGNGGNIKIVGNVAYMAKFVDDDVAVSGKPQPVYIVTDDELVENGGLFKLRPGQPLKLKTISGEPIKHGEAIPIYDIDPAPEPDSGPALGNLVFWVKSDTAVFEDSAGTIPATNGNPWGRWNDQSGNGNDVAQSTTSKKGVFNTNVINGLPALTWDDLDDALPLIASMELGTSRTIFVVAKSTNSGFPASTETLIGGQVSRVIIDEINTATRGGGTSLVALGPTPVGTSFRIIMVTADPAPPLAELFFGGVSQATDNVGITSGGVLGATIGNAHLSSSSGWGGQIAEVLWYTTVIPTADINTTGQYLASRYALPWSDV